MKFLDTTSEYIYFKNEINAITQKTALSGKYLLGDNTKSLESRFSLIVGNEYSNVAVKNCTDAITMIVKKIWHPNMPIILPNFGAYPTSVAVHAITKNVHYVDVDKTFTIDTNKLPDIKNGIIIPVHLFGNNCDMKKIMDYAKSNNHIVIEDCAQSTGSGTGNFGHYSVFSFYPTKPLASMGDGGMICTRMGDEEYFRKFRFYGQLGRNMEFVGVNSRIDEFQAGIVLSKLSKFHELNEKRKEIACRYSEFVAGIKPRGNCVYHQFPLLLKNRKKVINLMKNLEIPYIIHYEKHVTDFTFLNCLNYKTNFRVSDKVLSIPVHPFLKENEIHKICEFLKMVSEYEIK
jgi:dTDP-4-amino-4,6-dideoxygalactose transaminase